MKLEELVNKNYNVLNQNDLVIWKYIQGHKQECLKMSLKELSKKNNVSTATISRFTQKLTLHGYSEFKFRLKLELETVETPKKFDFEDICKNYYESGKNFYESDTNTICKMIYSAKRIFIYATGTAQVSVAEELKRRFIEVSKFFIIVYGENEINSIMKLDIEQDLFIVISLSGETIVAVENVRKMKSKGIPIISITRLSDNPIARLCDENLYILTERFKLNNDFYFESISQYYNLIELLFLKYVIYTFDK